MYFKLYFKQKSNVLKESVVCISVVSKAYQYSNVHRVQMCAETIE